MGAVFSDCGVIGIGGDDHCCCRPAVYRSDKDRICGKLFGPYPPGTDSEYILPDIRVWKDGVEMVDYDGRNSYSFTIEEEEPGDPKRTDIILYKGTFYVIGEVHTVVDPYLEIEPEMIWVYPDWAVDNDVYSNTKWNVR